MRMMLGKEEDSLLIRIKTFIMESGKLEKNTEKDN